MPKQPRLIDADKVEEWLRWFVKSPENVHGEFLTEYASGTFYPTPPVQPDIKPGDKVRGKKKALYHGAGIGIVRCIFWDAEGH